MASRRVAIIVLACLVGSRFLDPNAWGLAMTALAIVLSEVLMRVIIGLPLGILAGEKTVKLAGEKTVKVLRHSRL